MDTLMTGQENALERNKGRMWESCKDSWKLNEKANKQKKCCTSEMSPITWACELCGVLGWPM